MPLRTRSCQSAKQLYHQYYEVEENHWPGPLKHQEDEEDCRRHDCRRCPCWEGLTANWTYWHAWPKLRYCSWHSYWRSGPQAPLATFNGSPGGQCDHRRSLLNPITLLNKKQSTTGWEKSLVRPKKGRSPGHKHQVDGPCILWRKIRHLQKQWSAPF